MSTTNPPCAGNPEDIIAFRSQLTNLRNSASTVTAELTSLETQIDDMLLCLPASLKSQNPRVYGLGGTHDYNNEAYWFLNYAKHGRRLAYFDANSEQQTVQERADEFDLDPLGYVRNLPADVNNVQLIFAWKEHELSRAYFSGDFVAEWDEGGDAQITGAHVTVNPSTTSNGRVRCEFTVHPTMSDQHDTQWQWRVNAASPTSYPKNLVIFRAVDEQLIRDGVEFRPELLESLQENASLVRFMSWQRAERSSVSGLDEMTPDNYITYNVKGGVPYDAICRLCAAANVDMWAHIPPAASDAYVTRAFEIIRDNLPEHLTLYMEYGNEYANTASGFLLFYYLQADFTRRTGVDLGEVTYENATKTLTVSNTTGLQTDDMLVLFLEQGWTFFPIRIGADCEIESETEIKYTGGNVDNTGPKIVTNYDRIEVMENLPAGTRAYVGGEPNVTEMYAVRSWEINDIGKTVFGSRKFFTPLTELGGNRISNFTRMMNLPTWRSFDPDTSVDLTGPEFTIAQTLYYGSQSWVSNIPTIQDLVAAGNFDGAGVLLRDEILTGGANKTGTIANLKRDQAATRRFAAQNGKMYHTYEGNNHSDYPGGDQAFTDFIRWFHFSTYNVPCFIETYEISEEFHDMPMNIFVMYGNHNFGHFRAIDDDTPTTTAIEQHTAGKTPRGYGYPPSVLKTPAAISGDSSVPQTIELFDIFTVFVDNYSLKFFDQTGQETDVPQGITVRTEGFLSFIDIDVDEAIDGELEVTATNEFGSISTRVAMDINYAALTPPAHAALYIEDYDNTNDFNAGNGAVVSNGEIDLSYAPGVPTGSRPTNRLTALEAAINGNSNPANGGGLVNEKQAFTIEVKFRTPQSESIGDNFGYYWGLVIDDTALGYMEGNGVQPTFINYNVVPNLRDELRDDNDLQYLHLVQNNGNVKLYLRSSLVADLDLPNTYDPAGTGSFHAIRPSYFYGGSGFTIIDRITHWDFAIDQPQLRYLVENDGA